MSGGPAASAEGSVAETAVLPHDITGPDVAPALLLVHPLGADRRFWDDCVALWRARYRCVACDLRAWVPGPGGARLPVSLDRHVADLDALRAASGLRRVVPIGTAIGSMVVLAYAARHADSTAALVVSNATPRTSPEARRMLLDRAATVRRGGLAAILPTAVDLAFLNQPRNARYRLFYDRFAAQPANEYADAVEASASYDATADLPRIRCPTLVCAGEHDILLPPERSRFVAEAVPQAAFELVAGAAHFVPFQAPADFARRVLAFLDAALSSEA